MYTNAPIHTRDWRCAILIPYRYGTVLKKISRAVRYGEAAVRYGMRY
jgi:hypothetical protein